MNVKRTIGAFIALSTLAGGDFAIAQEKPPLAVPCGEDGVTSFVQRHFLEPKVISVVELQPGGAQYGVGFAVGELECSGWMLFGQSCEALHFEQQCWPRAQTSRFGSESD